MFQVSVLMKVAEHVLDGQQLSGLVMVLQLKFEPVINSKENIYIIINLSHLSKAAYRFDYIHALHENQTYDFIMAITICSTNMF